MFYFVTRNKPTRWRGPLKTPKGVVFREAPKTQSGARLNRLLHLVRFCVFQLMNQTRKKNFGCVSV